MKPETQLAIRMLLIADATVDAAKRSEVLAACSRVQRQHRKLVAVGKAAELLGCHPKTVERYARKGLLGQVRFSPRKIRYDLDEVEAFARDGMDAVRPKGDEG
jgi:excisionase family DNA binding protein